MFKNGFKAAILSAALVAAPLAMAQNAAVVNGQAIKSDLVDFILNEQAKRGGAPSPEMRATIVNELVKQEVLRQEAMKLGLSETDQVKYQLEMMKGAIMMNALQENFFKTAKPTEQELQESYDKISKMISGTEYRASHILVESEDEAKEIIKSLNNGGDFAAMAKAKSKDPGSGANGGDLDWANPQAFVPEFSTAMVALGKGEFSKEPVKSQFGYHVILVTDIREQAPPPLEQIKDQLEERLLGQKWEEYQAALQAKAKIK